MTKYFYGKYKEGSRNAFVRILLVLVVCCLLAQALVITGFAANDSSWASANHGLGSSEDNGETNSDADKDSIGKSGIKPGEEESYIEKIEVADVAGLKALARQVNDGDDLKGVLVTITADIALDPTEQWIPIGCSLHTPFKGTFDGGDKTISGITVKKKAANDESSAENDGASTSNSVEDEPKGGLFGFLYEATIRDVNLKKVDAPNSVGGLYYSAVRCTITGCLKKWGPFGLLSARISAFATWSTWAGGRTTTLNTSGRDVLITSAEDFAQVAYLVNNGTGTDNFAGQNIILQCNIDLNHLAWTPIGQQAPLTPPPNYAKPFEGNLVGNDCIISNMDVTTNGGLFGYIQNGSISNLIIDNAAINVSGNTGILAHTSYSSITGVVIKDSAIMADEAAGIVHTQLEKMSSTTDSLPHPIAQCVVMNTAIESTTGAASGIAHKNFNVAVTQCAVYGGVIDGASEANGVVHETGGPNVSYSGISQNIILGTELRTSGTASGILGNVRNKWNAAGNNFVSDVELPSGAYLGTGETFYGIDSNFTDSRLPNPFLRYASATNYYSTNNVFDSSTVKGVRPDQAALGQTMPASLDGNAAYDTSYLTGGGWRPNEIFWEAKKDYYPYLINTMDAQTPYLPEITGLTSVAVLLDNPEETLDGAKEFRLVDVTPDGNAISWSATSSLGSAISLNGPAILSKSAGASTSIYTQDNNDVNSFNLKASITVDGVTLEKNFKDLTLKDSYLDEDVGARYPGPSTPPIATTDIPKLVFNDPVDYNAAVQGMIRLYAQRADGSFTVESAVACDMSQMQITQVGGQYEVTFPNLSLYEARTYRLVIPRGAVVEVDAANMPKNNFSEEIILDFQTITREAPHIIPDPDKSIYVDTPLSLAEVKSWFVVYDTFGGGLVHGVAHGIDAASQITGAISDPKDALASLTIPGVYFYVDSSLIGASRDAGVYNVHIFAVNSQGMKSRALLTVEVSSLPNWEADPPQVVHTMLTGNQGDILALVSGTAKATYTTSRGQKHNVPVDVEIDAADWAECQSKSPYPGKVTVYFYMLDFSGNRIATDVKQSVVYLDRGLQYSFNTGAMSYDADEELSDQEWRKQIEEGFDFVAINFADTAKVTFDHGDNQYRENGRYTVKMETARQVLTLCDGSKPCSAVNHNHFEDQVKLKFTVTIKKAKDINEDIFWQKVRDDILKYELNNTVGRAVRPKMPNSDIGQDYAKYQYVDMPFDIVEMLRTHPYNLLELNYPVYRWKFYGKEMEAVPTTQEVYPLRVHRLQEEYITSAIGKNTPAVQLEFEYVGKLHGRVEFAYDLYHGGLTKNQVENNEFYLYKFDVISKKLTPVTSVIVDGEGWASVVLTELENTKYLLAEKKFGGADYTRTIGYGSGIENRSVTVSDGKVLLDREVLGAGGKLDMFMDLTGEEVAARDQYYARFAEDLSSQSVVETAGTVPVASEEPDGGGLKGLLPLVLTGVAVVAVAAAGVAVYHKRRGA